MKRVAFKRARQGKGLGTFLGIIREIIRAVLEREAAEAVDEHDVALFIDVLEWVRGALKSSPQASSGGLEIARPRVKIAKGRNTKSLFVLR